MTRHCFLSTVLAISALALLGGRTRLSQAPPPGTDAYERTRSGGLALAAATGPRTSPFEPPQESDIQFVVDGASGLDTGCTYRSGGPLLFDIPITRYVGAVNGDGTLQDPGGLIAAGVLSPTAELILPAFDIDANAVVSPPFAPELDRISLNGEDLGFLSGADEIWKLNTFTVPIEILRFPSRGSSGGRPAPALNQVRIDIDSGNSEELWCMSVDWASSGFKAMSPVILVHGNNSNAGFWDGHGFSAALTAAKIPFDGCASAACLNPINLPTTFVAANGAILASRIPAAVASFGADSYHIVAHSKGGLDSREYLAVHQPRDLTLVSHNTLSTPHNGSLLADLGLLNEIGMSTADEVEFVGFPTFTQTLARLSGVDNGTRNLGTAFTASFNARNLPGLPAGIYNQVAADADRNASQSIDIEAEIAAMRLDDPLLDFVTSLPGGPFLATRAVDIVYQILRNNRAIRSTVRIDQTVFGLGTPEVVFVITAVPSAAPNGNDVLVTIPSGHGVGSIQGRSTNQATFTGAAGRNHSDVADAGVAATVIPWLLSAEAARGDLQ